MSSDRGINSEICESPGFFACKIKSLSFNENRIFGWT